MAACLGLLRRDPVNSTTAEASCHTDKLQDWVPKTLQVWPTTPREAWTAPMHVGQNCKYDYVTGSLINRSDWSRILLAVRLMWPTESVDPDVPRSTTCTYFSASLISSGPDRNLNYRGLKKLREVIRTRSVFWFVYSVWFCLNPYCLWYSECILFWFISWRRFVYECLSFWGLNIVLMLAYKN